jgi:hypothetical protein
MAKFPAPLKGPLAPKRDMENLVFPSSTNIGANTGALDTNSATGWLLPANTIGIELISVVTGADPPAGTTGAAISVGTTIGIDLLVGAGNIIEEALKPVTLPSCELPTAGVAIAGAITMCGVNNFDGSVVVGPKLRVCLKPDVSSTANGLIVCTIGSERDGNWWVILDRSKFNRD